MIPRTLFSSEHELFRSSVRKFLEQEAVPFHAQWEKQGYIDRALWNKAGEQGMLCSHLPEEYGGMAADFLYSTVVIEVVCMKKAAYIRGSGIASRCASQVNPNPP